MLVFGASSSNGAGDRRREQPRKRRRRGPNLYRLALQPWKGRRPWHGVAVLLQERFGFLHSPPIDYPSLH